MKLPVFSLFLQDKLQQTAVFHPLINYHHHPGFLSHLYLRCHAPSFSVSKTSACECFCPKGQFGSDFLCLCRPRWRGVALRRGRRRRRGRRSHSRSHLSVPVVSAAAQHHSLPTILCAPTLQQRQAGFKIKTPRLFPENRCLNQPEVIGCRVTRARKTLNKLNRLT